jgi:diguanylate cyclase (GGDEF)-like protein
VLRGTSTLTSAQLRASLDELTEDALRPVATALIGLSVFYTVVYDRTAAAGTGTCAGMSAVSAVVFLAIRIGLHGRVVRRSWASPLAALYGLVAGANCLVALAVTHNAPIAPNVMLAIVVAPLFLLSAQWLLVVIGSLGAGWYIVQNVVLSGNSWQSQSYPLLDAIVLAVLVYLVRHRSHRRLEETRFALRRAAVIDTLTGIYNRRGFLEAGQDLLTACAEDGVGAVLLFIDVDGLKRMNDTLGHDAGDVMLTNAAGVLASTFRGSDVVGRLGGDEFAVLLREPTGGVSPAVRLRKALDAQFPLLPGGVALSLSVGVAKTVAADEPLEQLLSRGDRAMYEGRSRRLAADRRTG